MHLTSTAKKTVEFFEDFIRETDSQNFLKRVRKQLGIPEDGIGYTAGDNARFNSVDETGWYTPMRLMEMTGKSRAEIISITWNASSTFLQSKGIDSFFIKSILRLYIIFNVSIPIVFSDLMISDDFLSLGNLESELMLSSSGISGDIKNKAKKYPIVLYMNPEVSRRQVMEFLSKNWWYVKLSRKKIEKTNVLHKTRKKGNRTRNDYIYKNRALPRKEIMKMVTEKFSEALDYGHIGKIISLEKKKRESN